MRLNVIATAAVLVAMTPGCSDNGGGSGQSLSSGDEAPVGSSDALLSSGDIFEVRVYGEKELSGEHRVGPDGAIDFPFVGRVDVAGLAPGQVASIIAAKLKEGDYLKSPHVSVFVKEYTSKRISVTGAVNEDGNFPITSGMTVVQAISLAGGFTPLASRDNVVVTRQVGGKLKRFKVHVESITEGSEEDFPLQAGDIIYVPERIF